MSLRKVFLSCVAPGLVLFGFAGAAHAQVGVYATVTGERITSITCTDPQSECASNDGVARPYGATFGVQYDWRSFGPVLIGFDGRGAILSSNKSAFAYMGGTGAVREFQALGGVRGTFHTPFKIVRPYVEAAAGYDHTNAAQFVAAVYPAQQQYQNFTRVQGYAGIDLALFPVLDFRVIELGAGAIFGPSTHGSQSIGVGVVFHMPTK